MVQIVDSTLALWLVVDARTVEGEAGVACVYGDCDGAVVCDSVCEGFLVAGCDVDISFQKCQVDT